MNNKIYSSNQAVNVLKKVGASGKFFFFALLSTLSIAASILAASSADDLMNSTFISMPRDFLNMAIDVRMTALIASIVFALPSLLYVIGLWMHHSACRNRKDGGVSTAGLTLIRILKVIQFIILLVGLLIGLGVIIYYMVSVNSATRAFNRTYGANFMPSEVLAVLIVTLIIFAVIAALVLAYYISVLKIIKRAKIIAETGVPDNRVSGYVIVINWIKAIFLFMGAIISIFGVPYSAISSLVSGFVALLIALILSEYKKGMTAVLYGINPPMVGPEGMPIAHDPALNPEVPVAAPVAPVVPQPQEHFSAPAPVEGEPVHTAQEITDAEEGMKENIAEAMQEAKSKVDEKEAEVEGVKDEAVAEVNGAKDEAVAEVKAAADEAKAEVEAVADEAKSEVTKESTEEK